MQITIDLPPDLEQALIRQADRSNIPLETLILQALLQEIPTKLDSIPRWSDAVLSYKETPDFPAFESYRSELDDNNRSPENPCSYR
ncbi:hypothetical protein V0288_12505 [Pannus brasiliensis CCIBt3594]|uniref:Uncharacterized protein n=1 Tax=Pannus brasiliensis CCIBt3594 TaxID=1427578 RepID=A0AAW9QVF8_9CHRO